MNHSIRVPRHPVPDGLVGPNAILAACGIPGDADGLVLWLWWLAHIDPREPMLDVPVRFRAECDTLTLTETFTVFLGREGRAFQFRLVFVSSVVSRDLVVYTYADVEALRREGVLPLVENTSLGEIEVELVEAAL